MKYLRLSQIEQEISSRMNLYFMTGYLDVKSISELEEEKREIKTGRKIAKNQKMKEIEASALEDLQKYFLPK